MLGALPAIPACKCVLETSKQIAFQPRSGVQYKMGTANDRQVGGSHYKTGSEEHWDRVARLNLDYFQAQITKYVERWRKKNGIEDLKKARHFLDKYIEIEEAKTQNSRACEEPGRGYVDQDQGC